MSDLTKLSNETQVQPQVSSSKTRTPVRRKTWTAPLIIIATVEDETENDKGFNFTPDHFIPSFGTFAS
jgi:hypothetical protein